VAAELKSPKRSENALLKAGGGLEWSSVKLVQF